jgi:hypothetical protein
MVEVEVEPKMKTLALDLRRVSYRSAVFTIVVWIVAKDFGGEASTPILSLLRRWRCLLFFHVVR